MMGTTERPPSKLVLERLALGELQGLDAEHRREELEQDPGVLAELATLTRDDEAFFRRYPPERMLPRTRARVDGAPSDRLPRAPFVAALGVAVAAIFLFVSGELPARPNVPDGRLKAGDPTLSLHRLASNGPERLRDGANADPGDRLQISFSPAGRRYAVIVSIDGRGTVTLHHPASTGETTAIHSASEVSLPYGYQLDEAPGYERFFLVTSNEPFAAGEVLDAAHRVASSAEPDTEPLPLRAAIDQRSFTLRKSHP